MNGLGMNPSRSNELRAAIVCDLPIVAGNYFRGRVRQALKCCWLAFALEEEQRAVCRL